MTEQGHPRRTADQPPQGHDCQLRIEGHLNGGWSEWLDGLSVTHEPDGTTVLAGRVADQAALRGMLCKLWDLNLTLLSVRRKVVDGKEEKVNG